MKKIVILLSMVIFAVSCSESWLEIPQKGVVSYDDYYQNEEDATAAITAVYTEMARRLNRGAGNQAFNYSPYIILYNLPSDDIYHGGSDRGDNDFGASINEFRHATDNETIRSGYRAWYMMIYSANVLLANYSQNDPNPNIARYVAEARVWRAWCHLMLAIGWGSPPLITEVLTGTERPENTPHEVIMEFVINELSEAVAYIPSKPNKTDRNSAVRLTKEAVYAFLGKAQVFAGKYADAANNLKNNVIDKDLFDLVPGEEMFNFHHVDGDGSVEKVFEFNVYPNTSVSWTTLWQVSAWQHYDYWNWRLDRFVDRPTNIFSGGWGGCNPSGNFARALIENDGIDSHRRKAWFYTYDEVLYEMPWPSDATNTTLEEKKKDRARGLDPAGNGLYGHEGYFNKKRMPLEKDRLPGQSLLMNNTVIMRYAEVLLLFTEACVRANLYQDQALAQLNKIQTRAGSNHVSTSLTLDEVKNEKRFEMWLEGCRWADLVRWGDAANVLKEQYSRLPYFRELIGRDGRTEHEGYVDWEGSDRYNLGLEIGFKANKHELFPFPALELQINPNIVQNPGW